MTKLSFMNFVSYSQDTKFINESFAMYIHRWIILYAISSISTSTPLSWNSTNILTFCSISTAAALFYGTPILFYGTSYVWQSLILDMKNALFLVPFASSKPRNCFCCVWHSWLAVQQIATQWDEIFFHFNTIEQFCENWCAK